MPEKRELQRSVAGLLPAISPGHCPLGAAHPLLGGSHIQQGAATEVEGQGAGCF